MGSGSTHRHLIIGLCADVLTFLGAAVLARDAILRVSKLKSARIDAKFRNAFPSLNLTDKELQEARRAGVWTAIGTSLLSMGFLLQLILRFLE